MATVSFCSRLPGLKLYLADYELDGRTNLLGALQDQLRDTNGIDPHRDMTPVVLLNPPRMRRQFIPTPPLFQKDPVVIAIRHRHGNGDAAT